jgi:hypothetical protein
MIFQIFICLVLLAFSLTLPGHLLPGLSTTSAESAAPTSPRSGDRFADVLHPQILHKKRRRTVVGSRLLYLQVFFAEQAGDIFTKRDEHFVRLFVQVIQLDCARAVCIFLDKDDITKRTMPAAPDPAAPDDRARKLVALEYDQGIFNGKLCMVCLL